MAKDNNCCLSCFDEVFHIRNLGFNHHDPSSFVRSQWPKVDRCVYIVYRTIFALGFTTWLIANMTEEIAWYYSKHPHLWFTYATNWVFFLLCMSYLVRAVVTIYYTSCKPENLTTENLPIALKCTWFLTVISWNSTLVVTIFFWGFILSTESSWYYRTPGSEVKHSLASILTLIDLFISCDPVRVLHLIYPILVGLFYVLFNAIYFGLDGRGALGKHALYTILDWDRPAIATATIFMFMIGCVLAQIVLHELYRLRSFIFRLVYPERSAKEDTQEITSDEQKSILEDNLDTKYEATGSSQAVE